MVRTQNWSGGSVNAVGTRELPQRGITRDRWVGLIPRGLLLVALPFVFAAAGCANASTPTAQPPGASSTIAETPPGTCTTVTKDQGLLLYEGWVDVVASKGSSDHQRRVERFADEADKIAESRRDDACAELNVMVVRLSSEASRLVAWMLIGEGEAGASKYQAVADAGNILMKRLGVEKQFATPGLNGT